jgi:hypothetical protein
MGSGLGAEIESATLNPMLKLTFWLLCLSGLEICRGGATTCIPLNASN